MKAKTADLTGQALAYAVMIATGVDQKIAIRRAARGWFAPQNDWEQGGPIIERERIGVWHYMDKAWMASWWKDGTQAFGPTPLVAAMRCYVMFKLGKTVDVPDELLKEET